MIVTLLAPHFQLHNYVARIYFYLGAYMQP